MPSDTVKMADLDQQEQQLGEAEAEFEGSSNHKAEVYEPDQGYPLYVGFDCDDNHNHCHVDVDGDRAHVCLVFPAEARQAVCIPESLASGLGCTPESELRLGYTWETTILGC